MKPLSKVYSVCPPSGNGFVKSVSPIGKRFQVGENWFGRVPAEVLADPEVSDAAVRVYAILALQAFKGDTSSIGIRQLAKTVHHGPRAVMRYLQKLEAARHIEAIRGGNGQRTRYRLVSPVFAGKAPQAQPESEESAAPLKSRRKRPLAECLHCHRMVGGLMRTGWCRTCTNKIDRRREIREVALEVVAEAVG